MSIPHLIPSPRFWFAGLVALAGLAAQPIHGQQLELSLQESITLAMDSSLHAFRAQNMYLSEYWAYRSYKAARLPSLQLRLTPIDYNQHFVERYDSEADLDIFRKQQLFASSGNLSLTQNMDWTGGTFFVDSELGFMKSLGDNPYSQFTSVPLRVGYSQALFGFNSFKWEKKTEPLKYEKAKRQFLYDQEEISEVTIEYFFALAMAQTELEQAANNLASADTLYSIGLQRHKIAAISQADLLTLKLDKLNAQNTLRNAQIQYKRSMFGMLSFLNLDEHLELKLVLPQKPRDIQISPDTSLIYAKMHNPNYLAYQYELLEAAREVEKSTRAAHFEADLMVSVGFNQVGYNLPAAYHDPLRQDVLKIGVNIPIVDWGVRKGRVNMAQKNMNVASISVQQKEQQLEQDVVMTVNDFNIQHDLIAQADEAMQLALLAYSNTKQRFIIGQADMSSLTLALSRQTEAQKNYILALKNYWKSFHKIRKLTLYDFEHARPLTLSLDEVLER